ncbi:ROK family protein [Emticicia sp. 21SJ11W-3]|uniref:ROK family protein n=1 Tax=Emticicia sp. 21SJ11W-3 TaxID=2916755 RepID=UPI00209F2237|nr:ROK family protein [Emticicia sp. 21SJ11W-3]UTA67548.1 ROK family protein [Emticicia sp. 21SJ11W-3]
MDLLMESIYTFDIGGSSVKHSLIVFESFNKYHINEYPIISIENSNFKNLERIIIETIKNFLEINNVITTIGISTAGSVDENGIVLNSGYISNYTNIDWSSTIKSLFPRIRNVLVMNDGRASAWAEYSGRKLDLKSLVHFVIGTGIGGATIINGQFLNGEDGFAGCFGHIKTGENYNIKCSCGKFGCLETTSSSKSMVERFNNINNTNFTLSEIIYKAQKSDIRATQIFEEGGKNLGIIIGSILNVINPKIVTIGGGLIEAFIDFNFDVFFKIALQKALENGHHRVTSKVIIKYAQYGNKGGMLGVALKCLESFHSK